MNRKRSGSSGANNNPDAGGGGGDNVGGVEVAVVTAESGAKKTAFKEKILQMYDLLLKGDKSPTHTQPEFWAQFFLLRPKIGVLEAEIGKLNAESLSLARENLNELFSECVDNLGEEHHIRVVYALQTLCGLVRAATKKQTQFNTGFELVNLIVGFDVAEIKMQCLIAHITE